MAPISVQLAMAALSAIVLLCLGTQVPRQALRLSALDWRTLLAILVGQWVLLPAILYAYLKLNFQPGPEELAAALVGIAPAGIFTLSTLYLVGVRPSANLLAGILLLELAGLVLVSLLVEFVSDFSAVSNAHVVRDMEQIAQVQLAVIAIPLLIGFGLRWAFPHVGAMLARLTAVIIWLSYLAMVAFAISLKAHFSYRVDVLASLPIALALIACSALAGLAIYLICAHLLRVRGQNLLIATVLIGLQGPVPALRMTVLSAYDWPELAAVAIGYAILLPLLAGLWVLISRTRRGGILLPY